MSETTMSVSSGISEATKIPKDQIAGRFDRLAAVREQVLERARDLAALTIPSVFPDIDTTEETFIPTPYQSVGARAVNNLSNKLLLTLFPVSNPFFKFELPEGIVQQINAQSEENVKDQIESTMSLMENIVQSDLEVNAFRPVLFECLRHLIIVGDFLIHIPKEGSPIGYNLNNYVVKRSHSGTVLELIVKERVSKEELPPRWKEQVEEYLSTLIGSQPENPSEKSDRCDLYTRVYLEDGKYHEMKYIHGVELEGSDAKYPEEASAWLPVRWNGHSGEDYGRSYTGEYIGDLIALEGTARAIQEHSAIASKTFGIIRPNSNMTPIDLARVPNGGFVVGEPEDLAYPEVGKRSDMSIAQNTFDGLVDSISRAFLITQVRDSERTTAEEIRLMASELETALGGAYSLLAVTLQKPLLMREIDRLKKDKNVDFPDVNNKDMEPKVIVGLEGLGRGTDLEKLMKAAAAIANIAPAAQAIPGLDMDKVVQFTFNAVGLDSSEVLKSQEQMAAEQQAAAQQQAQTSMGDAISKGLASSKPKQVEGPIENPEGVQQAADMMQQGGAAVPQQ